MNVDKDPAVFFADEPPGQKTNAVRWLQKQVMQQARRLPRDFTGLTDWEAFRARIRRELPAVIGIPTFPPMSESCIRGRVRVGEDVLCERVDVYVDQDYAIPSFVYAPREPTGPRMPGLVWNGGWPQDKWNKSIQLMALRMARKGFVVLTFDHAPFGETTPPVDRVRIGMTLVMSMGHVLGISQLALRAAETMRCGEYLRSRPDVDPRRVGLAGLCQGGMDSWLVGALDDGFHAVAPIAAESTFAVHFAEMASYWANGDSSPFPFGILKVCDIEHLHASIAPRPLLVRANLPDNWWPVSGFDSVEAFTRRIYRLYDAESRLDFRAEVHEHDITGPFLDALEAFLVQYLGTTAE